MNYRYFVIGRWVGTWTSVTWSTPDKADPYGFDSVMGIFIFNADGTISGEFRLKSGISYNQRSFTGEFTAGWNQELGIISGTATVSIPGNGNVNTMNFVRVNSGELTFIVETAAKNDGTLRTMMSQGTLQRVSPVPPWLRLLGSISRRLSDPGAEAP